MSLLGRVTVINSLWATRQLLTACLCCIFVVTVAAARSEIRHRSNSLPRTIAIRPLERTLYAVSVNDSGCVLGYRRTTGDVVELTGSRTISLDVAAYGACSLNNKGHVYLGSNAGAISRSLLWVDGKLRPFPLPGSADIESPSLTDADELLGQDDRDEIGLYKDGRFVPIIRSAPPGCVVRATAINDRHEIVGIIQGTPAGGRFASRPFAWIDGAFHYLPAPKNGSCFVDAVNNKGEIAGGFRPVGGKPRYAVVWRSYDSPMVNVNALAGPAARWHIFGCNAISDRQQLVGPGSVDGVLRPIICSLK